MLIGRNEEIEVLNTALGDERSHFIAVYGRRRIGKTYLIRETFGGRFTFQHAGIYAGSLREQLDGFTSAIELEGITYKKTPANWIQAFDGLKRLINQSTEERKVIFLDELSWMDTPKSGFIAALENFWNGYASARKDVLLIVCASATSWMLSEIVHNKGGLYHRLTEQIHLKPLSLGECETFVKSKGLVLNKDQIMQYYMIFGGIPYYWELLKKGYSLDQNIDRIIFAEDAPLKDEFKYLFASIFKNPEIYTRIIKVLCTVKAGMTREDIIHAAGVSNSGDLTRRLEELESCGFIRSYTSFVNKKKNKVYQLVDAFTLFYYSFLADEPTDEHFWSNQVNTPRINAWKGLAFERVCLMHIREIKTKLGIAGVFSEEHSWYCRPEAEKGILGSQIDLLIVRADHVINLCEMKYAGTEYTITEKEYMDIRRKIHDLVTKTGTRDAIFPTLITTYGLVENEYANSIQSVITLNDLFAH